MLFLLYKDHRILPVLLSSKNDKTHTYWKDPVFPAQNNEAALAVPRRVGFSGVTGVMGRDYEMTCFQ